MRRGIAELLLVAGSLCSVLLLGGAAEGLHALRQESQRRFRPFARGDVAHDYLGGGLPLEGRRQRCRFDVDDAAAHRMDLHLNRFGDATDPLAEV